MRFRHLGGRRGHRAVYETSSAEQVRWVLSDSGVVAVFAENAQRAAVIWQA